MHAAAGKGQAAKVKLITCAQSQAESGTRIHKHSREATLAILATLSRDLYASSTSKELITWTFTHIEGEMTNSTPSKPALQLFTVRFSRFKCPKDSRSGIHPLPSAVEAQSASTEITIARQAFGQTLKLMQEEQVEMYMQSDYDMIQA